MAAITIRPKIVGALSGHDPTNGSAPSPVDGIDVVLSHDTDKQHTAIGRNPDASRLTPTPHAPGDLHRLQINGTDFVTVLHRDKHPATVLRPDQMAGCAWGGQTGRQCKAIAFMTVNIDPVKAQSSDTKPALVRREPQLIGIVDPAHDPL